MIPMSGGYRGVAMSGGYRGATVPGRYRELPPVAGYRDTGDDYQGTMYDRERPYQDF